MRREGKKKREEVREKKKERDGVKGKEKRMRDRGRREGKGESK